MENNNNNTNDNTNNEQTNNDYFLTNEMKVSLPLDNNAIHTSQTAVQKFNGILSKKNLEDLTSFVIDGRVPINADPTVTTIDARLKDNNHITITKTGVNQGSPIYGTAHAIDIESIEGGYKFSSDETQLTTIIEKRLENDLGQQSLEGNRVFRSNVYVSMDVDAALALQNKSRMCRTMEVLTELYYAYNPSNTLNTTTAGVFVFDHSDYDNSICREFINRIDPSRVITISETNSSDVILAIARRTVNLGIFSTSNDPWVILLTNANNPLKCDRCVISYDGKSIDTNYTKLRFASAVFLAQYCMARSNYVQGQTLHLYSLADLYNWNHVSATRSKLQATTVDTEYLDIVEFDDENWGSQIYFTTFPSLPLSREKFNIQDYYTCLHTLVEIVYQIKTPYGYCNFDLSTNTNKTLLLPICDVGLRIAHDKNMCKAIINKTYAIEHRGLLANKVATLGKYRAGRLLGTISEVFGSLYNCKKIMNNLALYNMFWQIIDAQTVGVWNDEHIIGLIGHKRYSFDSESTFIANKTRSATNDFAAVTDPTGDNLTVEEYYPIALYWRSDVFGLPEHDEYNFENHVAPSGYVGMFSKYDDKIYFTSAGAVGLTQYQTSAGQTVNCTVSFVSAYSNGKTAGAGMYQVPNVFKTNFFINYVDRPLDKQSSATVYPISFGTRVYRSEIIDQSESSLESILFG